MLVACRSERERMIDTIVRAEQELRKDTLVPMNASRARELVALYSQFATTYRDDTLSAEYLFKAGELSASIGDYFQAIQFYRQCTEKVYYHKRPVAYFLMGFIYENHLNDTTNARRLYQEFLNKFPGHPLERDVRFSLQYLGRSPEELIREFEKKKEEAVADTTAHS
jgi:tetratricopeptide (TPR) repeat protein